MTEFPPPARRASYALHVVAHVRWPREGEHSFEVTRLRLVRLVDSLLAQLQADPRFRHFQLDAQTILLDDYLALRPEQYELIDSLTREGRLLIGPWFVVPDYLMCQPESLIRNLLIGVSTARLFGASSSSAYLPDGSGFPAQLPQLLNGFGLDVAAVNRGVEADSLELTWQAPDGSSVSVAHLRSGLDPLGRLPFRRDDAIDAIRRQRDRLAPGTQGADLLLMSSAEPLARSGEWIESIAAAALALPDTVFNSTLPAYLASLRALRALPVVEGELRQPVYAPLGQGTLSARLWIKARNHAVETLLTRWTEPFSAWTEQLSPGLDRAWRLLLENHAQDTLGGAVTDTVIPDIEARFSHAEQIGEVIAEAALRNLAAQVDTTSCARSASGTALIVFNPSSTPRTDLLDRWLDLPGHFEDGFNVLDSSGQPIQFTASDPIPTADLARLTLDRDGLLGARDSIQNGWVMGYALGDVYAKRSASDPALAIIVTVAPAEPQPEAITAFLALLDQAGIDDSLHVIELRFRRPMRYHLRMVAGGVPPLGFRTFGLARPDEVPYAPRHKRPDPPEIAIENAFLCATLDTNGPSLLVLDKLRGIHYAGLLKFRCEGDQGDLHTFEPIGRGIQNDISLDGADIILTREAYADKIAYTAVLRIDPAPEMDPRTAENVTLKLDVELTLLHDVPRLDVRVIVHNTLRNHRIRAHFHLPFSPQSAAYDGHFEVRERPIQDLPSISPPEGWAEAPLSIQPQRAFIASFAPRQAPDPLSGDESYPLSQPGLVIANRGLPEVEIVSTETDTHEIALTLLRSVSWLNRSDLLTRSEPMGPLLETPAAGLIGAQSAEFSIIPGDSAGSGFAHGWSYSDGPFRAATTGVHSGALPFVASLISSSHSGFRISAAKRPHDSDRAGLIVRGYNTTAEPITVRLMPYRPYALVDVVRIDETETGGRLAQDSDGAFEFKAGPHRILTFWLHD